MESLAIALVSEALVVWVFAVREDSVELEARLGSASPGFLYVVLVQLQFDVKAVLNGVLSRGSYGVGASEPGVS